MTSSANFTKPSFNYKKTEQAVGDDVPTPMNTITSLLKGMLCYTRRFGKIIRFVIPAVFIN